MSWDSLQELLLKLVEDNYPLAADPDALPSTYPIRKAALCALTLYSNIRKLCCA